VVAHHQEMIDFQTIDFQMIDAQTIGLLQEIEKETILTEEKIIIIGIVSEGM